MESKILSVLIDRMGYTQEVAFQVEKEILNLDSKLKEVFDAWLETGEEFADTSVRGFSLGDLKKDYEMNFIAAILTLDWLIKSPEEAEISLQEGIL